MINTVSDVRLNKALESELEQMFVERLRQSVINRGGAFTKIVVAGKPGYAIGLGSASWKLEPQCWLQNHFSNMAVTRADMVLWPAIPVPGVKPIAVYLDGWQFHAQSVPDDLALRQRILRSGKLLVWSATWDDVALAAELGKPKHYWEPQPNLDERIHKLPAGDACAADAQGYVDMTPFDQFLDFLAADSSKWSERARTIATSWFLQGMKSSPNRAAIVALVEKFAGPEAKLTLADNHRQTNCTHLADPCGVVAVAMPSSWRGPDWPEPTDITTVVGFEHRLAKSAEAKKAWSGALRLLNLLQFLPYFYIGCADSVVPEAALRPREAPVADPWGDITDVVLTDLLPLVQELCRRGAPTPEALYEAAGAESDVYGTFEIAWPDRHLGIVMDETHASSFPGWTVLVFNCDADLVDAIMEVLR